MTGFEPDGIVQRTLPRFKPPSSVSRRTLRTVVSSPAAHPQHHRSVSLLRWSSAKWGARHTSSYAREFVRLIPISDSSTAAAPGPPSRPGGAGGWAGRASSGTPLGSRARVGGREGGGGVSCPARPPSAAAARCCWPIAYVTTTRRSSLDPIWPDTTLGKAPAPLWLPRALPASAGARAIRRAVGAPSPSSHTPRNAKSETHRPGPSLARPVPSSAAVASHRSRPGRTNAALRRAPRHRAIIAECQHPGRLNQDLSVFTRRENHCAPAHALEPRLSFHVQGPSAARTADCPGRKRPRESVPLR